MAKGKKRKSAKRKIDPVARFVRPTEQREAHNDFRSAGAAVRVVPVIVRLHERGLINRKDFEALAYYRDQAGLADHSPMRSCCDFSPRGGHGPGVAIMSAQMETGRIERDLGSLWSMTRQIVVDDVPVERIAADRIGSFKLTRLPPDDAKKRIAKEVAMVVLELRFAAGRIVVNGK